VLKLAQHSYLTTGKWEYAISLCCKQAVLQLLATNALFNYPAAVLSTDWEGVGIFYGWQGGHWKD